MSCMLLNLIRALRMKWFSAAAGKVNAMLVTADKDFGELIFRQRLLHSGVFADPLSWSFASPQSGFSSSYIQPARRKAQWPICSSIQARASTAEANSIDV